LFERNLLKVFVTLEMRSLRQFHVRQILIAW